MPKVTSLNINGSERKLSADDERSLLSVLRDDLELSGAKYGCGEGQCGACTVLVDGKAIRSCITTVGDVVGKSILTIEGLDQNGKLHPVQEAFLEAGAMQCGYCTCGMIMSAVGLLRDNHRPTREEISRQLNGNVCRCGTYQRILTAVSQAASNMKESAS